jgi:S-adenosylmethionine-diacylgycerolhomoserine-N-methlytransferase
VELGGGTGRNLEYFGDRLPAFESAEIVDLCPSLLQRARERARGWPNVRVVEADATLYRPAQPVDAVYFSYALTMIPGWRRALDNAIDMLKPGGVLGIVDFYLPADGFSHAAGAFWRRWFAHDGVHLSPDRLEHARARLTEERFVDARARVPYLLGLRVPVYLFVGRRR